MSTDTHQKVYEFLKHNPMGVLATVSSDGKPWGAAVYFVVDQDLTIYFVTRADTFKYQNIEERPFASLTVVDEEHQRTAQMAGEVTKLPYEQYMDIFFGRLEKVAREETDGWAPPLHKVHAGNYIPLVLKPTKLQYADYGQRESDSHADYIEEII
jgi:nitroimidazol reductase NimA-like FMN-containing flavoprotein (pyridoxamine 5'-phosphate oxidase superfamily)